MNPIIQYIFYPIIVGGVVATLSVTINQIVKYFNKLNKTLVTLDKSINAFILEQAQVHSDQDKRIEILNSEVQVEKGIRVKHGDDISKLFKRVGVHDTEIEVIKYKMQA